MGRPLNKKYFGDAVDSIKVTDYFRVGGAETAGDEDTYIVSQRSTNKFLVADTSGAWSEILTLVDKDTGTLAAGEFRIDGTDADGATYNVARLYNRTLRLGSADNTFVKEAWSVAGAFPDLAITGISQADPAVVTLGDTTGLTDGDVITISGVTTMTEVNGNSYTVANLVANTSFELAGIDSTGFAGAGTGGTISGVGAGGLDVQAS